MNIDACIRGRRSCRRYLDKRIPLDVLGEVLEAGTYAPSAGNIQNWEFIVVTDEDKKNILAGLCKNQDWMREAPVHVVICNDRERVLKVFPDRGELYATQNCALAAGLIMMKAEDAGLGSSFVGSFDVEKVRNLFNIPEHIIPELIITLGYPDRMEKEAERISIHQVTSFENYGKRVIDQSILPLTKQVKKLGKASDKVVKKGLEKLKGLEETLRKR